MTDVSAHLDDNSVNNLITGGTNHLIEDLDLSSQQAAPIKDYLDAFDQKSEQKQLQPAKAQTSVDLLNIKRLWEETDEEHLQT